MGVRTGTAAIALLLAVFALGLGTPAPARAAALPNLTVQVSGYGKVTGLGLSCGLGSLACSASYGTAQTVTLTAVPGNSGWTLSGWQDDAASCGTALTCNVPVSSAQTATAVFTTAGVVQTYTLGVAASPNGAVTNDASNYAIDCDPGAASPPTGPQTCSLTLVQGSTITVAEAAATGYLFGGWGGSCTGTAATCSVYVTANAGISASFISSASTTLAVTIQGNGTVSGGGISCSLGATCDAQEPPGSSVTLTATAASGYVFTGWDGACSGTVATCTVQMDTARSVTATFDQLVPLTVAVTGNGSVSGAGISSCSATGGTCSAGQAPSSTVTLTASPASGGSVFWSGCTSASGNTCTVVMGTNANSVTATFSGGTGGAPVATNALTVSVSGDGYVTATAGGASIYCTAAGGTGCSANVPAGFTVTLTAVPASGVAGNFAAWTGDCVFFATTSCTLTMNGAKSAGAGFLGGNITYVLSAQVGGSGAVRGAGLDCSASGGAGCHAAQAAGATVTLTAVPSFGTTFAGWSGACTGTAATCTVTMTLAKTVTASFVTAAPGAQSLAITVKGAGRVEDSGGTCASAAGKSKLCIQSFPTGKAVALTAKPAAGFALAGWQGACAGAKATCTVTLASSKQVTATFARPPLAQTRKPAVKKVSTGYQVTLFFALHERGTLRLVGKLGGKTVVSRRSALPAGSRRFTVTVAGPGRYAFTVTLGKHAIRWAVKV